MNPDECRKAFEAWAKEYGVQLTQEWRVWQAAWNARTESKPVTREEIEGRIISVKDHHDPESWDRLIDLIEGIQLSAPQSPVVPGVEQSLSETILSIIEPLTWHKHPYLPEEARDRIIALLATIPQGVTAAPGVDLGWVRSLLLNMKPSKIDDTAQLIFDTIATGGRESREDRYREALADLTPEEPCRFDHHGNCQEHGFFGLNGDRCPVQKAKELLNG